MPGPVTPPRPARAVSFRNAKFEAVTSHRLAPYWNEAPAGQSEATPRI